MWHSKTLKEISDPANIFQIEFDQYLEIKKYTKKGYAKTKKELSQFKHKLSKMKMALQSCHTELLEVKAKLRDPDLERHTNYSKVANDTFADLATTPKGKIHPLNTESSSQALLAQYIAAQPLVAPNSDLRVPNARRTFSIYASSTLLSSTPR
ncbi:hypothetical protein L0F63_004653 [Massospora cicadina]|nr:hypothetical protein L0F63_004653 [Massospora cicadina]